ncbi:hypothetical protein [Paraburkholderia xenovorans]|uniref:hypothetical protein n=1 Tax=Paraburkholderia xenovorans TaxID=36873 RepID=UPI0015C54515|nr:hypothetical protein [Paraburkholderia xenovorans]NPT38547.1 hypothetical protein [Paraburkholderia xenovorans]
MNLHDEWVSPTDEETEVVARAALKAAWLSLAAFREGEDVAHNVATKSVLLAFAAALQVKRTADAAFEAAHPGHKTHTHFVEIEHVVATALSFVVSIDDRVHPHSRAGAQMLAFLSACKALSAFSEIDGALDDGSSFGAYYAIDLLKVVTAS